MPRCSPNGLALAILLGSCGLLGMQSGAPPALVVPQVLRLDGVPREESKQELASYFLQGRRFEGCEEVTFGERLLVRQGMKLPEAHSRLLASGWRKNGSYLDQDSGTEQWIYEGAPGGLWLRVTRVAATCPPAIRQSLTVEEITFLWPSSKSSQP
ncbi:MAG: hypothetical protein AMXMBFR33_08020 [Candidatus Xenobia bacterium]